MRLNFLFCFSKIGLMKYIGHLDQLKIFQRAAIRCGLPINYSEGFNPHSRMTFALPLPVGMEGRREYAQMELGSEVPPDEIIMRLREVMPEGIYPIEGRYMSESEKSSASLVTAAGYELLFAYGISEDAVAEFMGKKEIIVQKISKKATKSRASDGKVYIDTDIRPHIFKCEYHSGNTVRMMLAAGGAASVKPELAAGALSDLSENRLSCIVRLELYKKVGDGYLSLFDDKPVDGI